MSNLRRPPGPVRQLSLQQPPRRQQIRRQRSAEDEKPLQVFANPIRTRLQCNQDGKVDHDRPKVRVAWNENHRSVSNGVEVIARQIPGKVRPPTARSKVTTRPVIGEKASILYSRQELAERLRLAWKQREENRANIDIFLAHNTVETNCESRPSSCLTPTPSRRRKEVGSEPRVTKPSKVSVNNEISLPVAPVGQESEKDSERSADEEPTKIAADALLKKLEISTDTGVRGFDKPAGILEDGGFLIVENSSSISEEINDYNLPGDKTAADDEPRKDEMRDFEEEMDSLEKELRDEEEVASMASKERKRDQQLDSGAKEPLMNAKAKRANFSNHGGNLHKAITSGTVLTPPTDNREKITASKDSQNVSTADGRTRRTNSAPPQQRRQSSSVGRTQVSIVIDTPSMGPIGSQEVKSEVISDVIVKASISNRTIKSAPIKRRAKSGKRRAGVGVIRNDEGEEETETSEGKSRRPGGRGRPLLQTKVPDVVTMVSLVSSADSDSDIDQNSPRDDKLIHELRNKLPTTPIIKSSSGCPAITVLRKPIKSVSFQQESIDYEKDETPKEEKKWGVVGVFGQQKYPIVCRSGGSALPTQEEATSWKLELEATQPSIISRNDSKDHEGALVVPITDREKRCLAVPIGDPIRDKKRRLLRMRSTPPRPYTSDERLNSPISSASDTVTSRMRDQETSNDKTTTLSCTMNEIPISKNDIRISQAEIDPEPQPQQTEVTSSTEPQFQTRKERECWHLYRRMCDKGIYVSFDTVLRGMLTPTEYRLRQKETAPD